MDIEIHKDIENYKGLVNAIGINLNNNYFLLSCTKGFKLRFYDSDTKEINYKEIIPQKKDNNNEENDKDYQHFRSYKE